MMLGMTLPTAVPAPESSSIDERPRSVTVIGWTFLFLSLMRILLDSISGIVWKLGNAAPIVAFFLPHDPSHPGAADLALRQLPLVLAVQAAVAAVVAFIAYRFLRLRAWARTGLVVVCGVALAGIAAIAVALAIEWRRLGAGREANAVAAVVAALLAVGVLLGWVIRTLRRPDVRRAFQRGGV
jgi:hypothetical protein